VTRDQRRSRLAAGIENGADAKIELQKILASATAS
jgi:hypothetical protein